jgi:phosphoglycolate phosphatase-like HAD superfamily hydrolase
MDLSAYRLVIFDKDGTLIDFDAMWAGWLEQLAEKLQAATGESWTDSLYTAMQYDSATGRALAGGPLAMSPMADMRALTADVLLGRGLAATAAEAALASAWHVPDPVTTARPLVDLVHLFSTLRERGLKIAVATSDDHAPTVRTLAGLGLDGLVDVVVGADEGIPVKPAPDMVWAACRACGVSPAEAVMVGDSVADLQMGRAAGVGCNVGVTSGVSPAGLLAPFADMILTNVGDLITELET